jgi:hypothetical protein
MVVVSVGGVAGLVRHNAQEAHATTSVNQTTSTPGAISGGTSTVTTTESPPQATSGGS